MDAQQALHRAGRAAVLSHETAARLWGVELLDPGTQRLTVPKHRSRLLVPGWHVVRCDLPAGTVEEREGLPLTTVLRTLRDLCRVLSLVHAVVAADSALRLGLVPADVLQADLRSAFGRSCCRLRSVADALDPSSGSVLESVLRLLLRGAVPAPVTQFEIRDRWGVLVARVDFCWPAIGLVVEADGFAFHSDRAAYRRDRARLNELERLGWRVLRFSWEDVLHRPEHVVALVRECYARAA